MGIRLPSLERDGWQLRSGEASHREHPDTFGIPPLEARQNLGRGQAARLIFEVAGEEENDQIVIRGERMWVIVAERIGDVYFGILDNQPALAEPFETFYPCFGAEIPFLAEHVVDIAEPPADYAQWQLGQAPERSWPRNDMV